ncbi:MAG: GNAT family N-acetyltransferase, partial [Pseudomonadota bacterium]
SMGRKLLCWSRNWKGSMLETLEHVDWNGDLASNADGTRNSAQMPVYHGHKNLNGWTLECLGTSDLAKADHPLVARWQRLSRDGLQWPGSAYCDWNEIARNRQDMVLASLHRSGRLVCMIAFEAKSGVLSRHRLTANLHSIVPYAACVCTEALKVCWLEDLKLTVLGAGYSSVQARGLPVHTVDDGNGQMGMAKMVTNVLEVQRGGGDGWMKLSKNRRRSLRVAKRKLEEVGPVETHLIYADHASFELHFAQILAWKRAWLDKNALWGGAVRGPLFEGFSKARQASGDRSLVMHILTVNGRPISYMLLAVPLRAPAGANTRRQGDDLSGGHIDDALMASALMAGHDDDFVSASPATLHYGLILIGDGLPKGVSSVDLLPNHANYKSAYGAQPHGLGSVVAGRGFTGQLTAQVIARQPRARIRLALEALPSPIRRVLVRIMSRLKRY